MPMINANGCDFYYEQQGQGRDIVFIHGEIHGMEYWDPTDQARFAEDYAFIRSTLRTDRGD